MCKIHSQVKWCCDDKLDSAYRESCMGRGVEYIEKQKNDQTVVIYDTILSDHYL